MTRRHAGNLLAAVGCWLIDMGERLTAWGGWWIDWANEIDPEATTVERLREDAERRR